jgi:hypothetical protein
MSFNSKLRVLGPGGNRVDSTLPPGKHYRTTTALFGQVLPIAAPKELASEAAAEKADSVDTKWSIEKGHYSRHGSFCSQPNNERSREWTLADPGGGNHAASAAAT